jgi:hypothetical protein
MSVALNKKYTKAICEQLAKHGITSAAVSNRKGANGQKITVRTGEMEALLVLLAQLAPGPVTEVKIPQTIYRCVSCGSTSVSHAMWVGLNDEDVGDFFGSWCYGDNSYCSACDGTEIEDYSVYEDYEHEENDED